MASCANCKTTPISSNCVRIDESFSFEHEGELNAVLHSLDNNIKQLSDKLTSKIDKKWITEEKEYVTDYIQDLINKMGQIIESTTNKPLEKFNVNSSLVSGDKTALQLFTLIFKKLEVIQSQLNGESSKLYII